MSTFAIRIKPAVSAELESAGAAERHGYLFIAFWHMERAHVLGQSATIEHVRVHWNMFIFSIRYRRAGEALGQFWRIIAAAIFTAPGLIPEGNTGGTNISAFRSSPVPRDLKSIIDVARG